MARLRSRNRKFDLLVAATVLAGGGAIVAAILGWSMGSSGVEVAQRRERLAAMPMLPAAPADEVGWVEGTLEGRAPKDTGGLCIWVRDRYLRRGWTIEGRSTPEFVVVTTGGGRQRVVNSDYSLGEVPSEWAATVREEEPPGVTTGALRISGIANGDPVLVIGRRSEQGIVAESVAGLRRATCLDRLAQQEARVAAVQWWSWATFLALLPVTVWLVLRVRRSIRQMSPAEDRRRRSMDLA